MATARCDGTIVTDSSGYPICQDGSSAPLSWVSVEPFSLEDIDSEVAGAYFAVGFVLYGTAWLIGRAIGAVLGVIKR